MDIVAADPRSQARAYANMRARFVEEHNLRVSNERRQVAQALLSVDQDKRTKLAESRAEGAIDEEQQTVGAFIDAAAAGKNVKVRAQAKADKIAKNLTGKTTDELAEGLNKARGAGASGAVREVGNDAKAEPWRDVKAPKGSIYNPVESWRDLKAPEGSIYNPAEVEGKDVALAKAGGKEAEILAGSVGLKDTALAAGKGLLKNAGGIMNIGIGGYDLAEDIKAGKIEGANEAEKVSNVLQIASGALDVLAFTPLGPVAAGLGALAAVGSAVAEGIGKREEEQETEKKVGDLAKQAKSKIQAGAKDIGEIITSPVVAPKLSDVRGTLISRGVAA
jgi:hypothetical protein